MAAVGNVNIVALAAPDPLLYALWLQHQNLCAAVAAAVDGNSLLTSLAAGGTYPIKAITFTPVVPAPVPNLP